MRLSEMIYTEEEMQELREENKKLKWLLKEHITTYDVHFDELIEENRKLKLHIEAKDKAYTALLKDYEEIKEDRKKILDEIEAEIERFKSFRNR